MSNNLNGIGLQVKFKNVFEKFFQKCTYIWFKRTEIHVMSMHNWGPPCQRWNDVSHYTFQI